MNVITKNEKYNYNYKYKKENMEKDTMEEKS